MPLPNSVNERQQFLGIITYLGKFIPNLAEVTSPLRTLLKKQVEFKLEKPQLNAIGKLKLLVTTTSFLKTFNRNLQTRLKIDASSEGLGALLEQNRGTLPNQNFTLLDMRHDPFEIMKSATPKSKRKLFL